MKNSLLIKISLFINYMVFAILLNSVGAVILQVQGFFDVSKSDASLLEGFKDIPIAIASFILASFLPKIGIKRGMMIGLGIVAAMCFLMPTMANEFWYFKMLFASVGISFALIKISVFATIGLVTNDSKEHSSMMSWIEGFFMVGVLIGNVLFSLFVDDANVKSDSWLNFYWLVGGLSVLALLLLLISPLDESEAQSDNTNAGEDFLDMLKLVIKPLILIFVMSAFLYVLIEQSFQTWMPTFYNKVLEVPASMGIQAGAILAGAAALGRILAGFVLKKVHWLYFLQGCLVLVAACVLINLPLAQSANVSSDVSWFNAPLVAYIFPLMGLFLAPIYPTINSVILTALPKYLHSSMSGLIVVFSALGGTFGSMITGHLFDWFDGATAFYMSLVPIALLSLALLILYRMFKKREAAGGEFEI